MFMIFKTLLIAVTFLSPNYDAHCPNDCNCQSSNPEQKYLSEVKTCDSDLNLAHLTLPLLNTRNTTGRARGSFLFCCCHPRRVEVENLNFTWHYQGQLLRTNLGKNSFSLCNNSEWVYIAFILPQDSGIYNCTIKDNKTNTTVTKSVYLKVLETHQPYCGAPKYPQVVPTTNLALIGKTVEWTCSANIGERWEGSNYSIMMYPDKRYLSGGKLEGSNFTIKYSGQILEGRLKLNVTRSNIGIEKFYCEITNHNYSTRLNFSLKEGVSEHEKVIGVMSALIKVSLVCSASFLLIIWFWWKFRIAFPLCSLGCQNEGKDKKYLYDIFLIHGDDSLNWVAKRWLPVVEEGISYSCYIPSRDMRGGQAIFEQEELLQSRIVVIVISPNLLKSEWASLACHAAISEALNKRTSICCILLENLRKMRSQSSTKINFNLLRILKYARHINDPFPKGLPFHQDKLEVLRRLYENISFLRSRTHVLSKSTDSNSGNVEKLYVFNEDNVGRKPAAATMSGSNSYWRLMWLQIYLSLSGNEEELFWCRVFLSLPSIPLTILGRRTRS